MIKGEVECRLVLQRCGIQLLNQIKLSSSIGFPGTTSHLSSAPIQYIVSTEQMSGWEGKLVNLDTEPIGREDLMCAGIDCSINQTCE